MLNIASWIFRPVNMVKWVSIQGILKGEVSLYRW